MAVRGHGNREVMRQRDAVVLPTGEKIQFTSMIKYLRVMVHRSLDSVDSVKANAAFGALSKPHVSSYVKGNMYERMVLSTLLYGSESWALTEKAWVALRNFHNTKVRQMNGTTRAKLGLSCIETSVAHRAIQWCGHVTRMTAERLPHRLMFAWVRHPRPDGGRPTSLGDTLRVHLRRLGAPTEDKGWIPMAKARQGPFATRKSGR